jgi:hypothetical protein
MRPLIDILEDERTLVQKLESIWRYYERADRDTFEILEAQIIRVDKDLDKVRNELRDYLRTLMVSEKFPE